jgi:signal transduction histidine kinase
VPEIPHEGKRSFRTVYLEAAGANFRIMIDSLQTGGRRYTIRIITSERKLRRELIELASVLTFCIPLAVCLASMVGYFLAGLLLKPVKDIVNEVRSVSGASGLGKRLPKTGTGDELDELTDAFNSLFERLEDSFKSMKRFTEDASHALITPVACIMATGERVLGRDVQDREESISAVTAIIEERRKLSLITDTLLAIARGEGMDTRTAGEVVNIVAMIRETAEDFKPLAENKCISLTMRAIVRNVQACIVRDFIRQAVEAVLDNAVKYTPENGTILVEVETCSSRDVCFEKALAASSLMALAEKQSVRLVTIRISDSGPGIPEESRGDVFRRFVRLKPDGDGGASGFGLGLSVVKWAVTACGGAVLIKDSPLGGIAVCLFLPLSAEDGAGSDRMKEAELNLPAG